MSLKPPNGKPSASEFGQLRAFLARSGVSQAQINQAIGTAANGRTRATICAAILAWLIGVGKATPHNFPVGEAQPGINETSERKKAGRQT